MLNYNSPIVQNMIMNTPPGEGNMFNKIPGYIGATPVTESYMGPANMQVPNFQQTMQYPQPQMINPYYPQPMYPQYSGYQYPYSPYTAINNDWQRFNSIFEKYDNPYLNANTSMYQDNSVFFTNNPNAQFISEMAKINNISFSDQMQCQTEVEQMMYKGACKALNIEVNEDKLRELDVGEQFNIKRTSYQSTVESTNKQPMVCMKVRVVRGDEILSDYSNRDMPIETVSRGQHFVPEMIKFENIQKQLISNAIVNGNNHYDKMKQRVPDNIDMVEFFNNPKYFATLYSEMIDRETRMNQYKNVVSLYSPEHFQTILNQYAQPPICINGKVIRTNNHLTSYSDAVKRFYYPDGINELGADVTNSPIIRDMYGDPEVLTYLTRNPETGKLEANMPPFMKNRAAMIMDNAREKFKIEASKQIRM